MRITQQYKESGGQGLLEVVLVLVLFGAAVGAAVPAYLGFQDRQAKKAAEAHFLSVVQVAQAYRMQHGSYRGMDAADLLRIDPRVSLSITVAWAHRRSYCLTDTVHGKTWSVRGPYTGDAKLEANASCA